MEIGPTQIINEKNILRSIGIHKYEGALIYMKDNPEITSIIACTREDKINKTPIYKWILYRVGNDVWEKVIVDDVVHIQHPFRFNFFD